MKYLMVVLDGASDEGQYELGGRTPLQSAYMPTISQLSDKSRIGLVRTIQEGLEASSEVGNISLLGYDAKTTLNGRAGLELAGIDRKLGYGELGFRLNLVSLVDKKDIDIKKEKNIISSLQGVKLLSFQGLNTEGKQINLSEKQKNTLSKVFSDKGYEIVFNEGYKHLVIRKPKDLEEAKLLEESLDISDIVLTPPHQIEGKEIAGYLPRVKDIDRNTKGIEGINYHDEILILRRNIRNELIELICSSKAIIGKDIDEAQLTLWFWGLGKRINCPSFSDKYNLQGSVISGVNLIRGMGKILNMSSPNIQGATGDKNTDYLAKSNAGKRAFESGDDFVFIHIEAPDECSHSRDLKGKIKSLEEIDEKIIKPLYTFLKEYGEEFKILVTSDHKTLVRTGQHCGEPVPYLLYSSSSECARGKNNVWEKEIFVDDSGLNDVIDTKELIDLFMK